MRYSKEVIKRFYSKRFIGGLDENDIDVYTGTAGSVSCGDMIKIFLLIRDEKIEDVKIKVFGCTSAFAATVYLAELIIYRSIYEASAITNSLIAKYLDLPKIKTHCSILAEEVLADALNDYNIRNLSDANCIIKLNYKNNKALDSAVQRAKNITVHITDQALAAFRNINQNRDKKLTMILTVLKGSCGITYSYTLSDAVDFKDYGAYKVDNFVLIYSMRDFMYVNGLKIDYTVRGLDSYIVFSNSLAVTYCPCNSSIQF